MPLLEEALFSNALERKTCLNAKIVSAREVFCQRKEEQERTVESIRTFPAR